MILLGAASCALCQKKRRCFRIAAKLREMKSWVLVFVPTGNHHLEVRADLVAGRTQIDVGEHEADDDQCRQVVKHGNRHQTVIAEYALRG